MAMGEVFKIKDIGDDKASRSNKEDDTLLVFMVIFAPAHSTVPWGSAREWPKWSSGKQVEKALHN
jgi:hypothetical protein